MESYSLRVSTQNNMSGGVHASERWAGRNEREERKSVIWPSQRYLYGSSIALLVQSLDRTLLFHGFSYLRYKCPFCAAPRNSVILRVFTPFSTLILGVYLPWKVWKVWNFWWFLNSTPLFLPERFFHQVTPIFRSMTSLEIVFLRGMIFTSAEWYVCSKKLTVSSAPAERYVYSRSSLLSDWFFHQLTFVFQSLTGFEKEFLDSTPLFLSE